MNTDIIRASICRQWRERLIEEAQRQCRTDDPIKIGSLLAKLTNDYSVEIERDIADEIEALKLRQSEDDE